MADSNLSSTATTERPAAATVFLLRARPDEVLRSAQFADSLDTLLLAGTDPSRVIKGKKMPGQYGNVRHTAISIRVEKVDAERNLIYLRGSVAGPTNGIVFVRKQG